MSVSISIVGMACEYPDARNPQELWENVLAQRRAFRRMPAERLNLNDYFSEDRHAADHTYSAQAAVIEGYSFDRVAFKVTGETYRSADPAHWLALDIASRSLADAGFPEGEGLARERTGVVLGNTLTGEFSRANVLRLRWPYVRRMLGAALSARGWPDEELQNFLHDLEARYKSPFPGITEETLAGGLSNTIAGRICNHFDFRGGGYTVDGACASSLLAVSQACAALASGDLDCALAGGVDLSLDPFELVGFAKTNALANGEMLVYDKRSSGFWPGEGCGFVVLMRTEDALAANLKIYANIRGWGISSDGSGGITRPESKGQLEAIQRAYRRAGFGIETVGYFEGHGTGTQVGDATELTTLSQALHEPTRSAVGGPLPVIGSIKANVGHTKAAAGLAGIIKAAMAVAHRMIPPNTGVREPHEELSRENARLRLLSQAEGWPGGSIRAGVSAMGFGGINTHVVLENPVATPGVEKVKLVKKFTSSSQDCELFLFSGEDDGDILTQVNHLAGIAERLSYAELGDLAAELFRKLRPGPVRAALLAASPSKLSARLANLSALLERGGNHSLQTDQGVFIGGKNNALRIGFLFPGQAAPVYRDGGALGNRFDFVRDLYADTELPSNLGSEDTALAQPAIAIASLAGLRMLRRLEIEAETAVGHSIGELTALNWAGVFDEIEFLEITARRGQIMSRMAKAGGKMMSLQEDPDHLQPLIYDFEKRGRVRIAAFNGPAQTVISGEAEAIERIREEARSSGISAFVLPVSHAFHSSLMLPAADAFRKFLSSRSLGKLQKKVFSTVTGGELTTNEDYCELLTQQIVKPVRFAEAIQLADPEVDLWIECGPGNILGNLVSKLTHKLVVGLDAGGPSLRGLLETAGAVFALGGKINPGPLFEGRFTRSFSLDWRPTFFASPCESAPLIGESFQATDSISSEPQGYEMQPDSTPDSRLEEPRSNQSPLETIRELVAQRAEWPKEAVRDDHHVLNDLHLNSISVGQLVVEATKRFGILPPGDPTHYAAATVGEIAQALEDLIQTGQSGASEDRETLPGGVESWVRAFTTTYKPTGLKLRAPEENAAGWKVFAPKKSRLGEKLTEAFSTLGQGSGIVVCASSEPDVSEAIYSLLNAAQWSGQKEAARFVLVLPGPRAVGAGFVRTFQLEYPRLTTCVVFVPDEDARWAEVIVNEALSASGHVEARYDQSGNRTEPVLKLLEVPGEVSEPTLGPDDVMLVTGGGKGIGAECALSLAKDSGAKLILIGRSDPNRDAELRQNLDRMRSFGIRRKYVQADVTDLEALKSAVVSAIAEMGPVSALLHGAGVNEPCLISALDERICRETLRPKVAGLENLLKTLDGVNLKFLIAFSSIIGRTGLAGEAHYALANEWLSKRVENFQKNHPSCRCLSLEWSVWSGTGMGERLGVVETLQRQGVSPVPTDRGIDMLRRLISMNPCASGVPPLGSTDDSPDGMEVDAHSVEDVQSVRTTFPIPVGKSPALPLFSALSHKPTSVVISSRFGFPPTVQLEEPELPLLRFVEKTRVFYPGVELVVDVVISSDTDPYLNDHVFQGEHLLPAVIGIEAMTQVAVALSGSRETPILENLRFHRPVIVPKNGTLVIRLAALKLENGDVRVVLRNELSGFQTDDFEAICRFAIGKQAVEDTVSLEVSQVPDSSDPVILETGDELYGKLLFHTGRFQRVRGYHHLTARECVAIVNSKSDSRWFVRHLPAELLLGDPAVRDAAIHCLQACIPHTRILPVGVDQLIAKELPLGNEWRVSARERRREGDFFIYDLRIQSNDGTLVESWKGLRLKKIASIEHKGPFRPALLACYLERRLEELTPLPPVSVAFGNGDHLSREDRSDATVRKLVGETATTSRRPDGRKELLNGRAVSIAHAGAFTLAVSGFGPLGCDLEPVAARSAVEWRDLLGPERYRLAEIISQQADEDLDVSATRVWSAGESLKKAGALPLAPLTLFGSPQEGWVVLQSGSLKSMTYVDRHDQDGNPLSVAVTVDTGYEIL